MKPLHQSDPPIPVWEAAPGEELDFCSDQGARLLKFRIEEYWRTRGHLVAVAVQNVGFHPAIRAARFDVRSDMINGLPRRCEAAPPRAEQLMCVDDFDDGDLEAN